MAAREQPVIVAIAAPDDDLRCLRGQRHERAALVIREILRAGRRDGRIGQLAAAARRGGLAVECRAFSDAADPALPGNRLVDDAHDRPAVLQQCDERSENGAPGHEADGAVDGVQHPLPPGPFVMRAVFLADDTVAGEFRLDDGAHGRFGRAVRLGHGRGVVLALRCPIPAKQWLDSLPRRVGEPPCERDFLFQSHCCRCPCTERVGPRP